MNEVKVLGVDDELPIRKLLERGLKAYDYRVITAGDGQTALNLARQTVPDVVILDVNLGSQPDGVEVCRELRQWTKTPIIILSVREDKKTKLVALNAGADDYVTKPFDMEELEARIRAVLRRSMIAESTNANAEIHIKDLIINLIKHRVTLKGEDIHLTPKEYDLLSVLAINPGKVLTYPMLRDAVWHEQQINSDQVVRVFVNTLRKKLGEDITAAPQYIFTEPGIGYRFADQD